MTAFWRASSTTSMRGNKYLVTAIPKNHHREKALSHCISGPIPGTAGGVVAIEGRLYEIHNGMVQILLYLHEQINLNIAW